MHNTSYGDHRGNARVVRRIVSVGLCLIAMVMLGAQDARDSQPDERGSPATGLDHQPTVEQNEAILIGVPLPIHDGDDTRIKRAVGRVLAGVPREGPRPVLVLEFRSREDQTGEGSKFGPSFELANFLTSEPLSRVQTVAYIPGTVKGHAVLVAMACEQIVMSWDGQLGDAGGGESVVKETYRAAYREIAALRRTLPVPVALGMLDRQLGVARVSLLDGTTRIVTSSELSELKQGGQVFDDETIIPEGEDGLLSARELRKMNAVTHLVNDRKELALALHIRPSSVEEDPTLGENWRAVRADLNGQINAKKANELIRGIHDALNESDVNLLCLIIDSPGGTPLDAVNLANYLAGLDPSRVRTVAYIADNARSVAGLVAMACDDIVMTPQAVLGGPGDPYISGQDRDDLRAAARTLAAAKHTDWSLIAAVADRYLVVNRYRREGTGAVRYFCEKELGEQEHPELWQNEGIVETKKGLDAPRALQLDVARYSAANFDELRAIYDLEEELPMVEPSWAITAIEQLARRPWFARTLLFIGFFALISEASAPGIGAAGFVSGLCFLLFFWSQFLNGNAGWLEVLLFLAGVICIALEIFVIPGLGIFGIGGGLMIIASIVLASQTFLIPRNPYQLAKLPSSLFMVVWALGGAFVAVLLMHRLLPNAPIFSHLMLRPPAEEERTAINQRESLVSWSYLTGKRGVTTTQLTPSGKARFGDEIVDVISEGELVALGTPVYVVEVTGNRVVVQPVEENPTAS